MNNLKDYKPKYLTIGAGGMKGLSELGSIWWWWTNGNLDEIMAYCGSSIGAIICVLLALEYTPYDIMQYALETKLFDDISQIQFTQIVHEYGILSNSNYSDNIALRLTELIVNKMGKIPNLKELYEFTGKRIIIIIASLKQEKEIAADHNSHPNLGLLKALRSASNVPVLFGKLEHQKDYWCDGAILNPFPINHLDDGVTPMLAIGVLDNIPWSFHDIKMIEYYNRIVNLPIKRLTEFAIANSSDAVKIIMIPVSNDPGLGKINNDVQQRLDIFMEGYWYTDKIIQEQEKTGIIWNSEPELNKELIERCFESKTVNLLMRCMKENPEMLQEIFTEKGVDLPFGFSEPNKPEIVKEGPKSFGTRPFSSKNRRNQNTNNEKEDEEPIIEIPRRENQDHNENRQHPFLQRMDDVAKDLQETFGLGNYDNRTGYSDINFRQNYPQASYIPPGGITFHINISENVLNGIFGLIMNTIQYGDRVNDFQSLENVFVNNQRKSKKYRKLTRK
tara:strand:+ start:47230 stop:48741 length:1512 start_codon:yes stop_codon:yes gene_type:complete